MHKYTTKQITIDVEFYENFIPPDKYEEATRENNYRSSCELCPFYKWDDDTAYNDCVIGGYDKCPIKKYF